MKKISSLPNLFFFSGTGGISTKEKLFSKYIKKYEQINI